MPISGADRQADVVGNAFLLTDTKNGDRRIVPAHPKGSDLHETPAAAGEKALDSAPVQWRDQCARHGVSALPRQAPLGGVGDDQQWGEFV